MEWYKAYFIAMTRFYGRVPGFKTYSRIVLPRLQRNFWRTWVLLMVVSLVQYIGVKWVAKRLDARRAAAQKDLEELYATMADFSSALR